MHLFRGNGIQGLWFASMWATRCGDGARIALLGGGRMQRSTGRARAQGCRLRAHYGVAGCFVAGGL